MIDGKQLATVGFEKIGTAYEDMDCQKFIEWCLKQCGLDKDLAGSNAWFREILNNGVILTPEECVAQLGTVPAGAFLFILEMDGGEEARGYHDGLGNASHIGIVTGKGKGAIHSSKTAGGVAESPFKNKTIKNGGWNRVGLYNKVAYDYTSGGSAGWVFEDDGGAVIPVTPDPELKPAEETATVWSEDDLPVNTRKGPGTGYAQSKAGKLKCGTVVQILKRQKEWAYIRCVDKNGATWYCWMMDKFLKTESGGNAGDDESGSGLPADPEPSAGGDAGNADPDVDFTPGNLEVGSGDEITLKVRLSREEAAELLSAMDAISWQLVQILGGRG